MDLRENGIETYKRTDGKVTCVKRLYGDNFLVDESVWEGAAVFPLCLSPELYSSNPEYINTLYNFMKDRPEQPVHGFISQCDAVLSHDCVDGLDRITAPTYITFGERDIITPPKIHGEIIRGKLKNVEMKIFEDCLHSPILEKTDDFNKNTLEFLISNSGDN